METGGQFPAPQDAALTEAMDALWRRFLPEMIGRVAILESTAADNACRALTEERCEAAQSAAHKLAGVLGTFGLARGTELARELEIAFSPGSCANADAAARLMAATAELRALIENRESGK